MKKKVHLKTLLCLAIGVLFVSAFAMLPVGAAGNVKDTEYSFTKDRAGTSMVTEGRKKEDKTYVYMYCTYCPDYGSPSVAGQYTAYVEGSKTEKGTYIDCSLGHVYTFRQGTETFMLNWVKEGGYSYARVTAQYNGGSYPLYAKGVWSPDSVGGPN